METEIYLKDIYNLKYFDQFEGNEKIFKSWQHDDKYAIKSPPKNINKYMAMLGNSQNGEDGVLNYIFKKIGTINKYFVEFGAGDGEWFSNSFYFRKNLSWTGLLLEGNLESIKKAKKNINLQHEIITKENINDLFKKYNVPKDFDLLSLDIDSYDYQIFKAIDNNLFSPRVIIIETHPGLPNDIPLYIHDDYPAMRQGSKNNHPPSPEGYYGTNLLAVYDLAKSKGYQFVTTVKWNAIFVRNDSFPKLEMDEISRESCIKNHFKPNMWWIKWTMENIKKMPPFKTYS